MLGAFVVLLDGALDTNGETNEEKDTAKLGDGALALDGFLLANELKDKLKGSNKLLLPAPDELALLIYCS